MSSRSDEYHLGLSRGWNAAWFTASILYLALDAWMNGWIWQALSGVVGG